MTAEDGRAAPPESGGFQPAGAPPPPPTRAQQSRAEQRSHPGLQWALRAIGAAVLVVGVATASFGLGFLVGRDRPASRIASNVPAQAGQGGAGQLPGAAGQTGQRLQQLQQYLQNNDASLLRGTVTAVSQTSLTVDTPQGSQTISLGQDTRFPGAGAAGASGSGGAAALQSGQSVWVVAKKGADGKLQALAVRVGNAGAATPAQQQ